MVYEGPEGYVVFHVAHDRIYIHAGLVGDKTPSTFKRQREILDNLEVDLEAKGIQRYYTAVKTLAQARYAEWLGFELNGEGIDGTDYEIMVKEL